MSQQGEMKIEIARRHCSVKIYLLDIPGAKNIRQPTDIVTMLRHLAVALDVFEYKELNKSKIKCSLLSRLYINITLIVYNFYGSNIRVIRTSSNLQVDLFALVNQIKGGYC